MIPTDDLNKNEINLKNPEKIGWGGDAPRTGKFNLNIYSKIDKISRPVFWTALAVFVLTAAGIGFYFYSYLVNRDIAFTLNAPQNVLSGVPFDIEAGAKNNFNNSLNDVKISLVLPDGAFFTGENQGKRYYDKNFGNLGKDANFQERISVVIIPGGQTLKFDVKISYYTPALGSKARFEQTRTVEVSADEPALKLDISAPQKILNNEDFEVEIRYQNISNIQFENTKLKLDYPSFFTFKSATVTPSSRNNIWKLGSLLAKGVEGNFTIKGKVVNPNDSLSNFEIIGELTAEISGQKYSINKKSAQLNIASSPLILNVSLNNNPNYIASLRDILRYRINYRNSSDIGLNDIVITAKLTGEMFDFKTLVSNSFFDSKSNTITWNVANTPNLRVINPGGEGYVEFQIQAKEYYPIKRQSDKNFTLNVAAEISSPTVPYYVSSDKTISFANLKNNVSGAVTITAKALFYDPSSGINNKGQLPQKVNQPTNFTIHWALTNYSTDVSNVKISAFLQSGVRWTGQVKSSINSVPSYDERTQEVIWNIDKVLATQGVILSPIEAIFQVEATPNVTQAGQNMPLLGQIMIQAKDDFNNIILNNSASPLTSGTNIAQ